MWTAFASVMSTNVEDPIMQLEAIRSIVENSEPKIASETARMLGFDMSQDVMDLNADNFTRIVTQLALYPDKNGTDLFVKFIDLALNAVTKVTNLYTRDYVNFYDTQQGALVIDGGHWFKTTHVDLELYIRNIASLTLAPNQTLLAKTKELFFIFAPISFVINRFLFVVELDPVDVGLGAVEGPAEMTITLS
jgi:hypothetical protein